MQELVKIFKALSEPNRIRILKMLEKRPLCVCEITSILELANSTVSQHLTALKEAGLIYADKEGKWIYYKLVKHPVTIYWKELRPLLKKWLNENEQVRKDVKELTKKNKSFICE